MGRLANMETQAVQANRLELAREKAIAWGVILVLKGAHTIIATPDGAVAVLPFKNDALATAGTGDILAGLIAGLLAQGMKPRDAAIAGGYIHGLAGEFAAARSGNRSVIAGDVIHALSAAFQAL
jgi:NAD(P)H-hydrate repair Nnr-like enzyme with NAD(P)H-hydrate dehydratase domain